MSGYEYFESRGLTVASVAPNPHIKPNPGCMFVVPSEVHDRIKHDGIMRLRNRADEIAPDTLVDLLSPGSENRFPAAAYLHDVLINDKLARVRLGDKSINIVYFPHEIPPDTEAGRRIGIETALISVLGYEPDIQGPTTVIYHRGKPLMSVNGTGEGVDITTDEASLASLYDALRAILQAPLAQVKAPTLLKHTEHGSLRYLMQPSQMFS